MSRAPPPGHSISSLINNFEVLLRKVWSAKNYCFLYFKKIDSIFYFENSNVLYIKIRLCFCSSDSCKQIANLYDFVQLYRTLFDFIQFCSTLSEVFCFYREKAEASWNTTKLDIICQTMCQIPQPGQPPGLIENARNLSIVDWFV